MKQIAVGLVFSTGTLATVVPVAWYYKWEIAADMPSMLKIKTVIRSLLKRNLEEGASNSFSRG